MSATAYALIYYAATAACMQRHGLHSTHAAFQQYARETAARIIAGDYK